jgi:hypothetical protein
MADHSIESYSFGRMEVDGRTYTRDLILYPGRIQDSWWRREGHNLVPDDIPEVIAEKPDVLVVGTGASGVMEVPESTRQALLEQGIETVAAPTDRAVKYYQRLQEKKRTVGAFHLTC